MLEAMFRSRVIADLVDPAAAAAERYGLSKRELTPRMRAALFRLDAERRRAEAEIARLEEELAAAQALAERDPLLPVLNRRAFLAALQRQTAFVERYGHDAAVLYIDLDGFKAINDGFGHAVGDAILRHVARLLMDNVRETDSVGRLGGDEFGVILAHVGREEAQRKAAALKKIIAETPVTVEGIAHKASASIGVHPIARSEDAEAALAQADEAMYAAKFAAKRALVR